MAQQRPGWAAAGLEGLCFKRLDEPYRGGVRSWRKRRVRFTTEAVIGAVTGSLAAPRTVLLGRYDTAGRRQYIGRSTALSQAAGRALAGRLTPSAGAHPREGWTISAGWGAQETVDVVLVRPEVVMEPSPPRSNVTDLDHRRKDSHPSRCAVQAA
ncbi:hypothetical protein [Streptomyces sp. NPDC002676]